MKSFAKFARERIRLLGKSQKTLAEALGVSPAYVSQILTGKKNPPDLGRPRNSSQLKTWSEMLQAREDDILELVRFELHRLPPRPDPRFGRMRDLLVSYLGLGATGLAEELRSMEFHPAESRAISALVKIYVILHEDRPTVSESGIDGFTDFCNRARLDRNIVEGELVDFCEQTPFTWTWDPVANDVHIIWESARISEALDRVPETLRRLLELNHSQGIPVIGTVTAGDGFDYHTDAMKSEGWNQYVDLPPGVPAGTARLLYCVRVVGESLREIFGDGTLLFVKHDSWQEIRDGDAVIFRDTARGKAFVKKLELAGDSAILKSKTPLYKDIVIRRADMVLLERVISALF